MGVRILDSQVVLWTDHSALPPCLEHISSLAPFEGKHCCNRPWGIFLPCAVKYSRLGGGSQHLGFVMNEPPSIKNILIDLIYEAIHCHLNLSNFYGQKKHRKEAKGCGGLLPRFFSAKIKRFFMFPKSVLTSYVGSQFNWILMAPVYWRNEVAERAKGVARAF